MNRFKDFSNYIKKLGYKVKVINFCDFEFYFYSDKKITDRNLIEVCTKFETAYSAKVSLNNSRSKIAGGGFYHKVETKATVERREHLQGLGGDGIAMVMGIKAVI